MSNELENDPPSSAKDDLGQPEASAFSRPLAHPVSVLMLAPCPFPTSQGTQVVIRHLATELARSGHDVHLVTYGYGEPSDDFAFHMHRTPRIEAGMRSGPSLLKPAADAALLWTAARVSRAHRCDLIHAHNVEGLGVGALLKMQTGLPLVYHAHNAMGPELPTYFRAHLAQAFASLVGEVLDRTLPRAADAVIVFDVDHKALHEGYGVSAERVHVIPPGLDASELGEPATATLERARGELGDGRWILYAGNPDAYQNLELLWAAMAIVRERAPAARLVVATRDYEPIFQAAVTAAGIADVVRVYSYRDLDELRALHRIAEVGVSPRSLWTGAPIKVLNYFAAGLPVVACRSGARHVVPPSAGTLVDDEPAAFAAAVVALLERSPAARRGRAQRRAFERFRIDRHVPLYERVYGQVLAQPAQPSPVPED